MKEGERLGEGLGEVLGEGEIKEERKKRVLQHVFNCSDVDSQTCILLFALEVFV